MKKKLLVYAYILTLVLAAAALGFVLFERQPLGSGDLLPLVVFAVFVIGVGLFEIRTSTGFGWVPTPTIDAAVWIMFGPTFAFVMEIVATAVSVGFIRRRSFERVVFNVASMSLATGLAGVVYHALPLSRDLTSPAFLIPALISHMAYSLINSGLVVPVLSFSEGRSVRETLRHVFGWHFLSSVIAAPLAAFLIFSHQFAGLWSLLLFGIPLFIIYQAHRLFEDMKESHKNTVAALTTALEADEPYTHGHSYRVAQYAVAIGKRMGMTSRELETLEYAGMLHDIGKIAITNDIVCKPARLTKDEFDILSAHPAIGGEIVEQMKFLREAADLVRHHHERPDGQGYPDGLKGNEISLGSHILNLCDAIDAMCSNRPYRAALTLEQCVAEVKRFRGTQFEKSVVDAFVDMVEEGTFEIIAQADGSATEIQRILRQAAQPFQIPSDRSRAA